MNFRKDLYKYSKFALADEARARRSERLTLVRGEKRMEILSGRRNIFEDADVEISTKALPPPEPVQNEKRKISRAEMLQKWKQEKLKRVEEIKKKQKPVFKVGIVHRKATGSPLTTVTNTYANKNYLHPKQINKASTKTEVTGIITRSKAKLQGKPVTPPKPAPSIFLKIDKNKKKPVKQHNFVVPKAVSELPYSQRITIPQSPQITKSSRKAKKPESMVKEEQKNSIMEKSINFNVSLVIGKSKAVEKKVREMEVSSSNDKPRKSENNDLEEIESRLKNLKSDNEVSSSAVQTEATDYVPIHYSPYVNKVRGSAKKSPRNSKISLTMDVNQQIEKEENEFKCRIFSFRKFVECQTRRLLEKCDEWKQIAKDHPEIPNDVEGEINCIVGKTNLLTSDKFKQFKDLIDKCEQKDPMIKIDDLQGFQDWVAIEVDKIDDAFNKLEERKQNNWRDKSKPQKNLGKVEKIENKENKNPPKQPAGKSNIRAHILAARKLMRQNAIDLSPLKTLPTWAEAVTPSKRSTPKKEESLIKSVLHSETKKKNSTVSNSPSAIQGTPKTLQRQSSGLEIMAATQIAKQLTPGRSGERKTTLPQTTSFVNIKSTPGKGILKMTPGTGQNTSKRSVVFKLTASVNSPLAMSPQVTVNRLSEKYFAPPKEDEDSTECDSIEMGDCSTTTPTSSSKTKRKSHIIRTPVRKSARLANK